MQLNILTARALEAVAEDRVRNKHSRGTVTPWWRHPNPRISEVVPCARRLRPLAEADPPLIDLNVEGDRPVILPAGEAALAAWYADHPRKTVTVRVDPAAIRRL